MKRALAASLLILFLASGGCQAKPEPEPTTSPQASKSRLLLEKSPYLQQHADNTVDWYPWGEEAFRKAKDENKPIFLSIGYSTCHWCHVMEKESFMDPKVGAYLKEHFVSIKVDRETRPDVDAIYMEYVQTTTGGGGWPLTVFLTPNRVPFFGGTYFPNPSRFGRPGFLEILAKVSEVWKTESTAVVTQSGAFAQQLAERSQQAGSDEVPSKELLAKGVGIWTKTFDEKYGGFSKAPKFPSPPDLDFLLRYARSEKDASVEKIIFKTLREIALGGIRDHLEGGFHRYSTDQKWLVPHFEKMLYDQAGLTRLYSQAYAWKKEPLFKDAVESTFRYLENRMRSPGGAFYSAEDADSTIPGTEHEHAEGAFYVWEFEELKNALTAEEFALCVDIFGLTEGGNAEGDASGELDGKNVLHLKKRQAEPAFQALVKKLMTLRDQRERPLRDDKILTEWNGMLAAAYADASRYLEEPSYLETARSILKFLEKEMVVDGNLQRSYLGGSAEVDAFAVDHAQMVNAYLAVFEAGGSPQALERALFWQDVLDQEFWDEKASGYFDTRKSSGLIYRKKSAFDGAAHSTNSLSALNLGKLYQITGDDAHRLRLEALLKNVGGSLQRSPTGLSGSLSALYHWYGSHESIIVVSDNEAWWRAAAKEYQPERTLVRVASEEQQAVLKDSIPFLPAWTGQSASYVCKDFACGLPLGDLGAFQQRLQKDVPKRP